MLKIYNTLSNQIEPFKPLDDKEAKIYVCGITPYDTTHLGHAFTYLFFDSLIRYLKFKGYSVVYTQNVTDIDDDILRKAKEEKRDWRELGIFWTKRFLGDLEFLNIMPPTNFVRATESIDEIIKIIKDLQKKGIAYEKNGNVYFEVSKFKNYGKLSKYNRKEMTKLLKERGGDPTDPNKRDPLDFILWQKSQKDEPYWKSPWGKGRPGWHIECSAMIYKFLGWQIDIHGGGADLIYPHHESEIAQSESFTRKPPFVKYWIHTAMVRYMGEKMSKSLGNLVMVSKLSEKYSSNTIRYLLLSHHYRIEWEFKENEMKIAKECVEKIEKVLAGEKGKIEDFKLAERIISFLDSDFDTPKTLDFLYKTSQEVAADQIKETRTLKFFWGMLGFI